MGKKSKASPLQTVGQLKQALPDPGLALFPPKRGFDQKHPGTPVKLMVNLFRLGLTHNRRILRYTAQVTPEPPATGDPGPEKAQDSSKKKPQAPPKIRKELSREIIDVAIRKWVSQEKPPESQGVKYCYLFDATGSNIYALFDMFAKCPQSQHQMFRVSHPFDTVVDGKLVKKEKNYDIKIFKGVSLNLEKAYNKGTIGIQDSPDYLELIRALNVIIRGQISTVPRNFLTKTSVFPFVKENQFQVNSPCVLANMGYFMSVKPTESFDITVNIANTVSLFHEEVDLLDMLKARYNVRDFSQPLRPDIVEKFSREISRKQIEARHKNFGTPQRPHYRKYRIGEIGGSALDMLEIEENGTKKKMSVQQYFTEKYNYHLKYPKLQCVIVANAIRSKIPLEVCHLVEKQKIDRRMTPDETAEVIKQTAVPPKVYFQNLRKKVDDFVKNSDAIKDFGLDFKAIPLQTEGFELNPFNLVGGNPNQELRPSDGQYNAQRDRFFRPASWERWTITFLADSEMLNAHQRNSLQPDMFSNWYREQARFKGVNCGPLTRHFVIQVQQPPEKLKSELRDHFKAINRNKVHHSIFVLARGSPDWIYRYLQYLEASVSEGRGPNESWTRISCLKYENYSRKIVGGKDFERKMFLSNLMLKYNTKLGGTNFILRANPNLPFLNDGWLFLSVDVCHPAPGDRLIQSVAAVIGMWDLTTNPSYCTRMRVQRKAREDHSTIEDVGEVGVMFGEILESYRARKKKLPMQIVVLRDGVSEGQFKIVIGHELSRIKAAISQKYPDQKPRLSCLVVQKRHKVRFMRMQPKMVQKKTGSFEDYNVQPGTAIDKDITHPSNFDFYFAPHKAIQGTSRPPHIFLIYDELGLTRDIAENMVHALSYLSPRCTKSTSIPTPVNLADLAAERGKNLVISWNDDHPERLKDDERLAKLNGFLSNLADVNYKNTLYYV